MHTGTYRTRTVLCSRAERQKRKINYNGICSLTTTSFECRIISFRFFSLRLSTPILSTFRQQRYIVLCTARVLMFLSGLGRTEHGIRIHSRHRNTQVVKYIKRFQHATIPGALHTGLLPHFFTHFPIRDTKVPEFSKILLNESEGRI